MAFIFIKLAIVLIVTECGVTGFAATARKARLVSLPPSSASSWRGRRRDRGACRARTNDVEKAVDDDNNAVQWHLLNKYHARGSWKGVWTTYDGYLGDVMDETVASVDLVRQSNDVVQHTHTYVIGAQRADCATCWDRMPVQTWPVTSYTPDNLRKLRLAGCGLVNGPTLLPSVGGAIMATELVLAFGDGRVRVVLQHAPVWEQNNVVPGNNGPPHGLRLFRVMVVREALRPTPPTAETERAMPPPAPGNPIFYRPVPPFDWHKMWGGTSWTWGPQRGNQGWHIDQLDANGPDAWHGQLPPQCWNLRLAGGIYIQAPKIVSAARRTTGVEMCRLAWMPTTDVLLRLEAGVLALQPLDLPDETVQAFAPPTLASVRCDMLQKLGDLEGQPVFVELQEGNDKSQRVDDVPSTDDGGLPGSSEKQTLAGEKQASSQESKDDRIDSIEAMRKSLRL